MSPDDRVPIGDDLVALCVLVAAGDGARPAGEGVRAGAAQRVPAVPQQLGLHRGAVALGALKIMRFCQIDEDPKIVQRSEG